MHAAVNVRVFERGRVGRRPCRLGANCGCSGCCCAAGHACALSCACASASRSSFVGDRQRAEQRIRRAGQCIGCCARTRGAGSQPAARRRARWYVAVVDRQFGTALSITSVSAKSVRFDAAHVAQCECARIGVARRLVDRVVLEHDQRVEQCAAPRARQRWMSASGVCACSAAAAFSRCSVCSQSAARCCGVGAVITGSVLMKRPSTESTSASASGAARDSVAPNATAGWCVIRCSASARALHQCVDRQQCARRLRDTRQRVGIERRAP